MGEAISSVLPQILGIAISPIPIIAIILMLFTPQAKVNAPAFAAGWFVALLVVAGIAYAAFDSQDAGSDDDTKTWVYIVKVVLALALILMALKQFKSRPKPGEPPADPPKWMQSIDQFTPVKAFGMGALLAGPNPKNLLLGLAAGTAIAEVGASTGASIGALIIYAVLASLTIAGPVIYYFVAGDSATKLLNEMKEWLGGHNAVVMGVLLGVIGVSLLSDGLQGLFS